MKRDVSFGVAAAVALAAAIGITSQYGRTAAPDTNARPTVTGAESRPATTEKAETSKEIFDNGPCVEIEEHLQDFLLNGSRESRAAPPSCYGLDEVPGAEKPLSKNMRTAAKDLHFVIATLPDPAYTHFSLSFDRSTEAIQEGAADEHYVYDSSWMPWDTKETSYALIHDQDIGDDRKKQQEEQPGIILFRKHSSDSSADASGPFHDALVVFVVGEEPTQGIHHIQFANAAAWIAALQPDADTDAPQYTLPNTGILGPSFSGSLPSLAGLLSDIQTKGGAVDSSAPLRIYSGNISGRKGVEWFVNTTGEQGKIRFASFQQNDDVLLDNYCRYLKQQDFDLRRLAIISEDETAYGAETQEKPGSKQYIFPSCYEMLRDGKLQGSPRLFYPRGIAAVRSAYQKESIFSSESSQSSAGAGRRTLSTDMADPEGQQHDTIRDYNTDQTAQSQEAVLQQIVSQLRAHQSEYIVLRSSNPLDQLFLAHYLRLAYPQGRIVTVGADLLLRRESGAARLSGIMTLSTYPLLPWESHWTRDPADPDYHSHRVFSQDGAEGLYIATRFLLHAWRIEVGQKLTNEDMDNQMQAGGYTKAKGPDSLAAGSYFVSGNDLYVNPANQSDPSHVQLVIHTEDNEVKSMRYGNGDGLHEYEFTHKLLLPDQSSFLPTDPRLKIADYATPFWIQAPNTHPIEPPPVWLSVLGRDDFWPIAAMNSNSLSIPSQTSHSWYERWYERVHDFHIWTTNATVSLLYAICPPIERSAYGAQVDPRRAWEPMPVSMRVALLAVFLWASFHLACCSFPSITRKPSHRAYFACSGSDRCSHLTLLVFASLSISSTATVLACAYGVMSPDGIPLAHAWLCSLLLLLLWIIPGMALAINVFVQRPGVRIPAAPQSAWLRIRKSILDFLKFIPCEWPSLLAYIAGTVGFYYWLYFATERMVILANRVPSYWRGMNLTSGVSPAVPGIALTIGAYLWTWHTLRGLAFFGPDTPSLPSEKTLEIPVPEASMRNVLCMFSKERAADPITKLCQPFTVGAAGVTILLFAAQILIACLFGIGNEEPIRSLGARSYAIFICFLIAASVSVMLANAGQLLQIWLKLRQLLVHLDRMPLRRSMAAIPGVSWNSVWKISGNVLDMRYKMIVSELECAKYLENSLAAAEMKDCAFWPGDDGYLKIRNASTTEYLSGFQKKQAEFAVWYAQSWDQNSVPDQEKLKSMQEWFAETAGMLIAWMLLPAWRRETDDLLPGASSDSDRKDKDNCEKAAAVAQLAPHIRHAERLVCYVYLGFIQNTLGRMRTLVVSILCLFISATICMASYPFDPRPVVNGIMVLLFLALGTFIVFVYAQMHRDPILSVVTNTNPGQLDMDFWIKLVSFGAGPVIGLTATIFPELTDFLFSWVAPGVPSMK